MPDDNRWCSSIVLHDFAIENVKWREWFDYSLAIFTKHGFQPTRLGVSGKYYGDSAKTLTFKGGYRKLEKYNFEGIERLSFMVMRDKDDYTSNFIIDVSLYPHWKGHEKSYMSIAIDELLQPFIWEQIEDIAQSLHQFTQAKYGYFFRRHLEHAPDVYPIGGAGTYIDEEDERLCRKWEESFSYDRGVYKGPYTTGHLRDIYKLNFLSQEHLDWRIDDKYDLQSWIALNPRHGTLKKLSRNFWSWYVSDELISSVRASLIPSGIILCI